MVLLGAIALEGLNLRVDLLRRQLVGAGPVPVAQLAFAYHNAPAARWSEI